MISFLQSIDHFTEPFKGNSPRFGLALREFPSYFKTLFLKNIFAVLRFNLLFCYYLFHLCFDVNLEFKLL